MHDTTTALSLLGAAEVREQIATAILNGEDSDAVIAKITKRNVAEAAIEFRDHFEDDGLALGKEMSTITGDASWLAMAKSGRPTTLQEVAENIEADPAIDPDLRALGHAIIDEKEKALDEALAAEDIPPLGAPPVAPEPAAPFALFAPEGDDDLTGHPTDRRLGAFLDGWGHEVSFGMKLLDEALAAAGWTNPRGLDTDGLDIADVRLDVHHGVLTVPKVNGELHRVAVPDEAWRGKLEMERYQIAHHPVDRYAFLPGAIHCATVRKLEHTIEDAGLSSPMLRVQLEISPSVSDLYLRPPLFRAVYGADPADFSSDPDKLAELAPYDGFSGAVVNPHACAQFVTIFGSDIRVTQGPLAGVMRSAKIGKVKVSWDSGPQILVSITTAFTLDLVALLSRAVKSDLWFSFHPLQGHLDFGTPKAPQPARQQTLAGSEDPDVTKLRDTFGDRVGNLSTLVKWVEGVREKFRKVPDPIGAVVDHQEEIKGKSIRRSATRFLQRQLDGGK